MTSSHVLAPASVPGLLAELRLVWWLRIRELAGGKRSKAWLWLFLFAAWLVLLNYGTYRAADADFTQAKENLAVAAKAAWPLWALIPLIAGGAGEVTSAQRLSPYPVAPRTHLFASWLSALLDYPYLVAFPPVFALAISVGGVVPGGAAAIVYVLGASAAGQLGAWLLSRLVMGRNRPGLAVAAFTFVGVVLMAFWSLVSSLLSSVASVLPGVWLERAAVGASDGSWLLYALAMVVLAVPALVHLVWGPALVRSALDVERGAPGAPVRSWGSVSFAGRGGVVRALVVNHLRSVLRATSTQAALAGAVVTPFLFRLVAGNADVEALATVSLISVLASAATLGVNSFAYGAGGTVWLLSVSITPLRMVVAQTIATFIILGTIGVGAVLLTSVLLGATLDMVVSALVIVVLRALVLAALGVRWSVRHPLSVDFDSLRNKVTTPRAAMSFFFVGVIFAFLIPAPLIVLGIGFTGHLAAAGVATALTLAITLRSGSDLRRRGKERVAEALGE